MKLQLQTESSIHKKLTCIIPISERGEFSPFGKCLDQENGHYLSQLFKQNLLHGKSGHTQFIPALPKTQNPVLLVGVGHLQTIKIHEFRHCLKNAFQTLQSAQITEAISYLTELNVQQQDLNWNIQQHCDVLSQVAYRFDHYMSKPAQDKLFQHLSFYVPEKASESLAKKSLVQGLALIRATALTKDLANTPPNICTPAYLAEQAKLLSKTHTQLKLTVIDEVQAKKLKMGALLAVGKGSPNKPRLICLEYAGSKKKQAPVIFVGKGITFDTGGISLKPGEGMVGMKYDMTGAATVLGMMQAVAELKLPIHVVGIIASAENMPSGDAYKPEDILVSMSGKTIEVLNTDAEGRLVLADALTYAERYKPAQVIDIATLTGAALVALGVHITPIMSNNKELCQALLAAGEWSYDRGWELPLFDEYQEQLKSPYADLSNIGGKNAGTITAGCFLSRFAQAYPWAHLDVAGTAIGLGGNERYASGRPIPMLLRYLIQQCE